MSNRLEDLLPLVQNKCRAMLAACARESLLIRVTQTLRTYAEQDALYAQGRTVDGLIVTAARGGFSWHNFGRAFDICQVGRDPYPRDEDWWEKVGQIGEHCGCDWGGRWKHPDRPHFEDRGGLTLLLAREQHEAESRNLA